MTQVSVECISEALIREYLSRKGFKDTLEVLDIESPRTTTSITNRMDLMKALHFQNHMKKNKDSEKPYKTMIEVMTKYFTERFKLKGDSVEEFEPTFTTAGKNCAIGPGSTVSDRKSSLDLQDKASKHGDLVIDEDVEGETVVGEGKGGLFNKQEEDVLYQRVGVRPQGKKPLAKTRGLASPISSSLDDKERPREMKYGRPLSWQKASGSKSVEKALSGLETKSSHAISTKQTPSDKRYRQSNFSAAGGLLNNNKNEDIDPLKTGSSFPLSARNSMKEVLGIEKEADERKSSLSRLQRYNPGSSSITREDSGVNKGGGGGRPEVSQYSVSESSIAQDHEATRSCSGSSQNSCSDKSPSTRPRSRGGAKKTLVQSGAASEGNGGQEIKESDEKTQRDYIQPDVDTEFTGEADLPSPITKTFSSALKSTPIDVNTAKELKMLIFGSLALTFPEEWKYQGFTFSDVKWLQFGIMQKKGGPCGVLASVQAVFLKELLFTNQRKASTDGLQPSPDRRTSCLCHALAKILWRAGEGKQAVVTVPTGRPQFPLGSNFKGDNLTETLLLYSFTDYKDLLSFLQQNTAQFELHGNHGAIHSVFSVILSRTIPSVKQDMDEASNRLLSAHFYCNQELVNLFLTGRAASNVFNDTMELDSGGSQTTTLRGLSSRNDIGLLSLFEHYKSCQVGTYYKTPVFPIWVVCSESHFSVIFCLNRDLMNNWRAERRFDLYYYDGLVNQDKEIRLTIDTTSKFYQPPKDDEMVPPIDLCIRTKWDGAEIDWNGIEPLL